MDTCVPRAKDVASGANGNTAGGAANEDTEADAAGTASTEGNAPRAGGTAANNCTGPGGANQ
jgi:hypothetical protein